ncbi:hypothetical protein Dimus_011328, partial [Dionaea muscipula]
MSRSFGYFLDVESCRRDPLMADIGTQTCSFNWWHQQLESGFFSDEQLLLMVKDLLADAQQLHVWKHMWIDETPQ